MGYFNQRTSTGIFIPSKNGFTEYKGEIGDGSINSITIHLGYDLDQVYAPNDVHNLTGNIKYICYELFTRNIVFIWTDKQTTYITDKDVKKLLPDFSVKKHFDRKTISDILYDAIENESLDTEFLSRVLKLGNLSQNGMFYSEKIDTYLYFTDGVLSDFHTDDGLFPRAKYLQKANPTVYGYISSLAYKYWSNDEFRAKKEINIQSEAWHNIPDAFGNEFIPLHRTENGGANMHMILVCHYNYPITLVQFKEINHGRYNVLENPENDGINCFELGNFIYRFDRDTDLLHDFVMKNTQSPRI